MFSETASVLIEKRREDLKNCAKRCSDSLETRMQRMRERLERSQLRLQALNPTGVLERGYAYVKREEEFVHGVSELCVGQDVNIVFAEEGVYTAQIVALDGRIIEDKVMSVTANEGVRIDINGEQGTYILRILNDKGVALRTMKLIKK